LRLLRDLVNSQDGINGHLSHLLSQGNSPAFGLTGCEF
jgi:hypothetical protein